MTVGINVDPNNPSGNPPARRLLAARLQGVRLTARNNPENRQYIADMLAAGMQVLAIVATGDNGGFVPPHTQVVLQIFNEPDLTGPTAMDPVAYAELFAIYRGTYPAFDCWTAGLASGQPRCSARWVRGVRSDDDGVTWTGVLASLDGGTSWNPLGQDLGGVNDLILGGDGQTLYAATNQGVWRIMLR